MGGSEDHRWGASRRDGVSQISQRGFKSAGVDAGGGDLAAAGRVAGRVTAAATRARLLAAHLAAPRSQWEPDVPLQYRHLVASSSHHPPFWRHCSTRAHQAGEQLAGRRPGEPAGPPVCLLAEPAAASPGQPEPTPVTVCPRKSNTGAALAPQRHGGCACSPACPTWSPWGTAQASEGWYGACRVVKHARATAKSSPLAAAGAGQRRCSAQLPGDGLLRAGSLTHRHLSARLSQWPPFSWQRCKRAGAVAGGVRAGGRWVGPAAHGGAAAAAGGRRPAPRGHPPHPMGRLSLRPGRPALGGAQRRLPTHLLRIGLGLGHALAGARAVHLAPGALRHEGVGAVRLGMRALACWPSARARAGCRRGCSGHRPRSVRCIM